MTQSSVKPIDPYKSLVGQPVQPWTSTLKSALLGRFPRWSLPANDKRLLLVSDYSAGGENSQFECYGFLVIADEGFSRWKQMMQSIRKTTGLGKRSIAFKSLNDQRRRSALAPLLQSASALHGLLVVYVVDKQIKHILGNDITTGTLFPEAHRVWKPRVAERAVRIACFGGSVLSIASSPGQTTYWCSDHDEAVDTPGRLMAFLGLRIPFGCWDYTFLPGDSHFCPITMRDADRDELQDLLAFPDLACGVVCEGLNSSPNQVRRQPDGLACPFQLSDKSLRLHLWYSTQSVSFPKITIMLRQSPESNRFNVSSLNYESLLSAGSADIIMPPKNKIVWPGGVASKSPGPRR